MYDVMFCLHVDVSVSQTLLGVPISNQSFLDLQDSSKFGAKLRQVTIYV